MKILVIYAHPAVRGFNSFILENVKLQLEERKIDFEVLDLYKMKYNPILKSEELYSAGNKKVSNKNKEIQKKIKKADKLIFIYPVWWSGLPAILKGFIDRIFVSGFAFKYVKGVPVGLLKKKAVVIQTSGGPRIYYWFFGNLTKRMVQSEILRFCAVKSKFYQIYSAIKLTDKKKKQIVLKVNKIIKKIV